MKLKTFGRIGVTLLIIAVFPAMSAVAKYMAEENRELSVTADSFYFETDLTDAQITSASPSIEFNIMNYADDIRVTPGNTAYRVTVKNDAGTQVFSDSGTISSKKHISSGILDSGNYTVEIVSTVPYSKTMTASVTVTKLPEIAEMKVEKQTDGGSCYLLTVATSDFGEDKTFTLSYNGAVPDPTDLALSGAGASSVTLTLSENSSRTFRFFPTDSALSANNFSMV